MEYAAVDQKVSIQQNILTLPGVATPALIQESDKFHRGLACFELKQLAERLRVFKSKPVSNFGYRETEHGLLHASLISGSLQRITTLYTFWQ